MKNTISLDGNILITAANKVARICKPLVNNLDVVTFRYARIYEDGSKFILSNNTDYLRFLYEEGHYINTWYDNGKPASQFVPGCHFWAIDKLATNENENWVGNELNKQFKYSDGMFYCFKQTDFVELFDFFSSNSNIYFINKKLLYRFMLYFKEQAKTLMQKGENERIYTLQNINSKQRNSEKIDEIKFINSTPIKQSSLNQNILDLHQTENQRPFFNNIDIHGICFSNREKQILNYLPQGKTAKQIALILGISYRTVERHLENIRIKTNINSRSELIEKIFFSENN